MLEMTIADNKKDYDDDDDDDDCYYLFIPSSFTICSHYVMKQKVKVH